jgi:hypothetical protein
MVPWPDRLGQGREGRAVARVPHGRAAAPLARHLDRADELAAEPQLASAATAAAVQGVQRR